MKLFFEPETVALIGGLRIASQVLRPHVVHFLDQMLTEKGHARVAEVVVEPGSELADKQIKDTDINRKVGLLIVAILPHNSGDFVYSPSPDTLLEPGSVVVVIGPRERVGVLESMARSAI